MSVSLSPASSSIMLFMILLMYTISIAFSQPQPAAKFDYYTLSQQWPSGVCNSKTFKCINQIPPSWTLYGYWPSNKLPPHPRICPALQFDPIQIKSLEPQLMVHWPNLKLTNTDQRFWEDQWYKHGSCSGLMQNDYFMEALDLQADNDLTTILQAQGFTPTGATSVITQLIIDAVTNEIYVEPFLLCAGNGQYLTEIHICFDNTTPPKRMNCPTTTTSSPSCGPNVIY